MSKSSIEMLEELANIDSAPFIISLKAEMAMLRIQNENFGQELREIKRYSQQTSDDNQRQELEYNSRLALIQGDNYALKKSLSDLTASSDQDLNRISNLQAQLASLQSELSAAKKERDSANARLMAITESTRNTIAEQIALKSKIHMLTGTIAGLREECENYSSEKENLEQELMIIKKNYAAIHAQHESVVNELNQVKNDIEAAKQIRTESAEDLIIRTSLQSLLSNSTLMRAENEALVDVKKELQSREFALKMANQELTFEYKKAVDELQRSSSELSQLNQQLKLVMAHKEQLDSFLANTQAQLDTAQRSLTSEKERAFASELEQQKLSEKLRAAEALTRLLRQELDTADAHLRQTQAQLDEAMARVVALQEERAQWLAESRVMQTGLQNQPTNASSAQFSPARLSESVAPAAASCPDPQLALDLNELMADPAPGSADPSADPTPRAPSSPAFASEPACAEGSAGLALAARVQVLEDANAALLAQRDSFARKLDEARAEVERVALAAEARRHKEQEALFLAQSARQHAAEANRQRDGAAAQLKAALEEHASLRLQQQLLASGSRDEAAARDVAHLELRERERQAAQRLTMTMQHPPDPELQTKLAELQTRLNEQTAACEGVTAQLAAAQKAKDGLLQQVNILGKRLSEDQSKAADEKQAHSKLAAELQRRLATQDGAVIHLSRRLQELSGRSSDDVQAELNTLRLSQAKAPAERVTAEMETLRGSARGAAVKLAAELAAARKEVSEQTRRFNLGGFEVLCMAN
jgi:chromosome segregation ATPase